MIEERRASPLGYAFFFVATLLAVAALFFLCDTLRMPKGWITAALSLAAAEWLIRRGRFTHTGIEAALWLGGLFAFIAGLPSQGKPEAILVFAAAAAVAGARVRNPWFGALAVVLALLYLPSRHVSPLALATAAQAISILAALARARAWKRVSTDRLFGAIAIAAPLTRWETLWWPYLLGGAITLAIALRLRDRMLLIAAAVSLAIAAVDVSRLVDYPIEAELIAAGAALVVLSVAISRALRGRTRGFVVTPATTMRYEEAVTIAATLLAQPPAHPAADNATFEGGGGTSGGGGASEKF
jgi:hypothetical protein